MQHLLDGLTLAAHACVVLTALWGWGRATQRLLIGAGDTDAPALQAWCGWALVVFLLHIVNFFFPVDWKVSMVFCAAGLFMLAALPPRRTVSRWRGMAAGLEPKPSSMIWPLVSVLVLLVLVSQALQAPVNYDSGLYHFQSVRWMNEHRLPPGLGNLHGRLAFNQSYFGFVALLNISPFWGHGHATAAVVLWVLAWGSVLGLLRTRIHCVQWLAAALLLTLVWRLCLMDLSSPSPDLPVLLLQIAIFCLVCEIKYQGAGQPVDTMRQNLMALVLLCVAAVMVKLSIAVFALVAMAVCLPEAWRDVRLARVFWVRLSIVVAAMGIGHAARGYVMSGMPMYPSLAGRLGGLDWAVAPALAQNEMLWIRSWARAPGLLPQDVLGNWDWFDPWLSRFLRVSGAQLLLTFMLPVAGWWVRLVSPAQSIADVGRPRFGRLMYWPLLAGTVFWFLTAPDPRFLGAIPALAVAVSLWLFGQQAAPVITGLGSRRRWVARGVAATRLSGLLLLVVVLVWLVWAMPKYGLQPIPSAPVIKKTTDSGLRVNVASEQCWDAPLPCTPYFAGNLTLRESHSGNPDLSAGFHIAPSLRNEQR